jgi:hypothetical protein
MTVRVVPLRSAVGPSRCVSGIFEIVAPIDPEIKTGRNSIQTPSAAAEGGEERGMDFREGASIRRGRYDE